MRALEILVVAARPRRRRTQRRRLAGMLCALLALVATPRLTAQDELPTVLRVATVLDDERLRASIEAALVGAGVGRVAWRYLPAGSAEQLLVTMAEQRQLDLAVGVPGWLLAAVDRVRGLQALPAEAIAPVAVAGLHAAGRRAVLALDPFVLVQRHGGDPDGVPADLDELVHGHGCLGRLLVLHPYAAPDAWTAWLEARAREGLGQAQLDSWLLAFDAQVKRYFGTEVDLFAALADGDSDLALVRSSRLAAAGEAARVLDEHHVPGLPATSLELAWPVGSRLDADGVAALARVLYADALATGPLADAGLVPGPRRVPVAGLAPRLALRASDAVHGSGRLVPAQLFGSFDDRVRGKGAGYKEAESWVDLLFVVLAAAALFLLYSRLRRSEPAHAAAASPDPRESDR